MPKRDWLPYGLAGLGILAALVVAVAFFNQPKCTDILNGLHNYDESAEHKNYEGSVTCEADCQVTFGLAPEAKKSADIAESKQNAYCDSPAELDLLAQTRMAHWTLVSSVLAMIGVLALIWTLWLTQQANRAAWAAVETTQQVGKKQIEIAERTANDQREIGQAGHAAFLIVSGADIGIWGRNDEKIALVLRNTGPSAAFSLRTAGNIFGSTQFGDVLYSHYVPRPTEWNSIIGPGNIDKAFWFGFDREEIQKKVPNCQYLFFTGAVLWQDIFHTWRGIRFTYYTHFIPCGPFDRMRRTIAGNGALKEWQIQALLDPFYKERRLKYEDKRKDSEEPFRL